MAAPITTSNSTSNGNYDGKNYLIPFAAVTFIFFIWGFITSVNDILTPFLKKMFSLDNFQASMVQFTFFIAFFILAIPSSQAVKRIGYKTGMLIGLFVVSLGAAGFIAAAFLPTYVVFLSALFILAGGITMLQVTANPYVTILGSPEGGSSRINLSQAFNSLGTVIGPLLWSELFLPEDENATLKPEELVLPYVLLVLIVVLTGLFIFKMKLPAIVNTENKLDENPQKSGLVISEYPYLIFAVIAIFMYVGAEVTIGNNIVLLFNEESVIGLNEKQAGRLVSLYWLGAMVGRFVGSALLIRMGAGLLLGIAGLLATVFLLVVGFGTGYSVVITVLSIGLFNSIMFPTIFSLGIKGLGKYTEEGTSLLIMAIVGGAIFPVIQGKLADMVGIQLSYLFPIISYLFIAFFGFKGHKIGLKE